MFPIKLAFPFAIPNASYKQAVLASVQKVSYRDICMLKQGQMPSLHVAICWTITQEMLFILHPFGKANLANSAVPTDLLKTFNVFLQSKAFPPEPGQQPSILIAKDMPEIVSNLIVGVQYLVCQQAAFFNNLGINRKLPTFPVNDVCIVHCIYYGNLTLGGSP